MERDLSCVQCGEVNVKRASPKGQWFVGICWDCDDFIPEEQKQKLVSDRLVEIEAMKKGN